MAANRILSLNKELKSYHRKGKPVSAKSRYAIARDDSEEKMSETVVDDDVFVIDILEYFFDKRLNENQLTTDLREIAAKCLWTALNASRTMDLVPRPPKGVPGPKWLVQEAVQIAYRRARNKGIYDIVKKTVTLKWRSAFNIALMESQAGIAQSVRQTGVDPFVTDSNPRVAGNGETDIDGARHTEGQSYSLAEALFSEAQYETGEHVLSGIVNESPVTPTYLLDVNGIKFSYGEIIAMGDFYEAYDDMARASAAELGRLKNLINRSMRYYEGKVLYGTPVGTDPGDSDWQSATNKRYLKLAEENFSHFAPSNSAYISFTSTKANNKKEWEKYHSRALGIMRAGTNSSVIENALEVNAFGDHFLTDSFAAGHLVNKDDLAQYFKSLVMTGGKVNTNGNTMFGNIAAKAFTGPLKAAFSKYETVEWKGVVFRPNINSVDRFKALLVGIMEKEPDVFGKTLVAKLVHDALNGHTGGVPVTNNVGDHWELTGDKSLNKKNLEFIKKAVKRSIRNLIDAVNDNSPVVDFYKKVWDIAPQPTPAGVTLIKNVIRKYTNPLGAEIVNGADKLLQENYQTLLDELEKRNILKKA